MRKNGSHALTQGHVVLYARDARWRGSAARSLARAGHTSASAPDAPALLRVLLRERFDVLILRIATEAEAEEVTRELEHARLPLHTIVLESPSVLPRLPRRRGGTLRFVPGSPAATELTRLVDLTISAGGWDEGLNETNGQPQLEEVDLEEAIERAAAAVYPQARRRRQRFHSHVAGGEPYAYADPAKLGSSLVALLRLVVSLAPYQALISVEAQAARDDWVVRIAAANGKHAKPAPARAADLLRQEARTISAVSRALKRQGGTLWVEVQGPGSLAFSLTLPLPPEEARSAS